MGVFVCWISRYTVDVFFGCLWKDLCKSC